MRKIFLLLIVSLLVSAGYLRAQVDAHFTQYYAYPLWLNPAFTGAIDGNYRVTANYRRQLPGIITPFYTQGLTADLALPKNFGVGLTILNQATEDGSYHYTSGYLSVAYQVRLTQFKVLRAGFQLGMLNRRVDPSKLQYGNQFNPVIGYDPSMPSNEIFTYKSATSSDGSLGILYFDGNPSKSFNPFIGVSLYHPTQPNNKFLSGSNDNKVPMRYSIHGGVRLKLSESADLTPHAIYMHQGNSNETAGGIAINLKLDGDKDLIAGGVYRFNDAVAPNIGLRVNGLTIGLSYDVNVSQFKTVSSGSGGYELSISFTSQKKKPETKFICPRL